MRNNSWMRNEDSEDKFFESLDAFKNNKTPYFKNVTMDLFENYHQLSKELQAVLDKWQQKEASTGLDYKDCKAFQEECEAVGYTFDYQLDGQPFDLRPINLQSPRLQEEDDHLQNSVAIKAGNNLSWYDQYITPLSRAYKDFIKEMEHTSSEHFFRDGERKFTAQEKKFMQIYAYRDISITNETDRQKLIADTWAKELSNRTELSAGMSYAQIDEKQAHHYRNYEAEAAKSDVKGIPYTDEPDYDENRKAASSLPAGWNWYDYDDGSGSLRSPNGNSYYSYDLQTQEYRLPYGKNEWTDMKDLSENSASLNEFKVFAENDLKEKAVRNHLSPKLSEQEINDLLHHDNSTKQKKFLLKDLNITQHQRESYQEEMEFGTTNGDYSLTEHQLRQLPDFIDGHYLSKNDKYELAYGLLQKQQYAEAYSILPGGEIIKMFLDEEEMSAYRPLTINEIQYNNQNPNIMETQKDFDQVQYLKDQLKYLGFGEGEQLHKDLEKGIAAKKQQFEIKTGSDKASPGNQVDFTLKFNKTERGGIFLNAYRAKLTMENSGDRSHNFPVSRDNNFTAKEAINLLEGRSVKTEFLNPKTKEEATAFVQFDFGRPKTEKGNYYFQNFYENYGVDTAKIVDKAELVFDKPEWKDNAIKSLEKGNIVKVKFKQDDSVIEGKAVLDPQNRNLKLYDNDMNRLNTNKPLEGLEQDHKHEKNNVKEQSIKR